MEFFVLLLLITAIYLPFLRLNKEKIKPIKIIVLPWIIYSCIIIFFGVEFINSNLESAAVISLLVFFSVSLFSVGHAYGKKTKNALYKNSPPEPFSRRRSRSLYKALLLLGLLGGAYFIFEKIQNLSSAISLHTFDLHQLRTSNNVDSELGDRGIATFLSRFFFSFCFLAFCFFGKDFSNNDKHLIALNKLCIITVFCVALISAGRLFILYYIAGFFLIKYINGEDTKRWQHGAAILGVLAMTIMFYFRAPSDAYGVKEFYMNLLKIKDAGFFFGLSDIDGRIFDSISIVAMYLVHSFGVLSEFYNYSSFNGYAYGGYSFNLPYRILNKLFSLEIPVLQDYRNDPSLGLYASFARDALADFGVIGSCIFLSTISLITGFSYSLRNYNWTYRVVTYWGMIYFAMAPLLSVISVGFITIMYFSSILIMISSQLGSKILKKL